MTTQWWVIGIGTLITVGFATLLIRDPARVSGGGAGYPPSPAPPSLSYPVHGGRNDIKARNNTGQDVSEHLLRFPATVGDENHVVATASGKSSGSRPAARRWLSSRTRASWDRVG